MLQKNKKILEKILEKINDLPWYVRNMIVLLPVVTIMLFAGQTCWSYYKM